jgi:hypothetical protein
MNVIMRHFVTVTGHDIEGSLESWSGRNTALQ